MRRARLVAAITAILTALLLQATLVAPVFAPLPVSLPALLVAAVAVTDGPAAGMSLGFATGLVADLGSAHPAGVLALCWLGVGLVCGRVADRRRVWRDAVSAGLVCAAASVAAAGLLAVVHSGPGFAGIVRDVPATTGVDIVLAALVVLLVRTMLRSDSLRAPHAVYTELAVGTRHG